MKILIKFLFILIAYLSFSNTYAAEEQYYKIGVFDYAHQTDMMVINKKNVTDNTININYLGDLTQIYDLMIMGDIDESYTLDNEGGIKNREEYALYISTGFQKKLNPSERIYIIPSFSVGFYNEFDRGKDMGFPIEFKSEIELNFETKNNFIFGVTYNHISNADIGSTNPGSDSIMIGFRYKTN